jgi:hypothetical protein
LHGVRKAGVARSIQQRIDFGFNFRDIPDCQMRKLVREVIRIDQGNITLSAKSGLAADITWRPLQMLPSPNDPGQIPECLKNLSEDCTAAVMGQVTGALHRSLDVRRDELVEEPVYRSIWNTLKAKRKQSCFQGPLLVVIRPGDPTLSVEWILDVLRRRIWPDYDFKRITAVLIHEPRLSFHKTSPQDRVTVSPNPNAASSPSAALLDMLEGKKKFLLP